MKLLSVKNMVSAVVVSAFLVAGASADFSRADRPIKEVQFNRTNNTFTIYLEDGQTMADVSSNDYYIKLDAKVARPVLTKGTHKDYLVFPTAKSLGEVIH